MCGTVVWLREPISVITDKPQADDNNPDPASVAARSSVCRFSR